MFVFTQTDIDAYKEYDPVKQILESVSRPGDEIFTCYRWLQESMPKRMIFSHLYGDLLSPEVRSYNILDVGGGYTPLTRLLVCKHKYDLLELMAHDNSESIRQEEIALQRAFWINKDWYDFDPASPYDILIANDLFPNVDQRLELFIARFLPFCREMRLSLTYYNTPRWYKVRRVDADEVFHMLAWDGTQLRRALEAYADRIEAPDLETLTEDRSSLFPNQRQVCFVKLRGDC